MQDILPLFSAPRGLSLFSLAMRNIGETERKKSQSKVIDRKTVLVFESTFKID